MVLLLIVGQMLLPEFRDTHAERPDLLSGLLSIASMPTPHVMRFYATVFGWELSQVDLGTGASWMVRHIDRADQILIGHGHWDHRGPAADCSEKSVRW